MGSCCDLLKDLVTLNFCNSYFYLTFKYSNHQTQLHPGGGIFLASWAAYTSNALNFTSGNFHIVGSLEHTEIHSTAVISPIQYFKSCLRTL